MRGSTVLSAVSPEEWLTGTRIKNIGESAPTYIEQGGVSVFDHRPGCLQELAAVFSWGLSLQAKGRVVVESFQRRVSPEEART